VLEHLQKGRGFADDWQGFGRVRHYLVKLTNIGVKYTKKW